MRIQLSESEQTGRGTLSSGGAGVGSDGGKETRRPEARRRVAIVARDEATLSLLRDALHDYGSLAICLRTGEGQSVGDIVEFLRAAEPSVVLYEVPFPYAENLSDFQNVARAEPGLRYILHTPCGELEFAEPGLDVTVLRRPFAVEAILAAVEAERKAAAIA